MRSNSNSICLSTFDVVYLTKSKTPFSPFLKTVIPMSKYPLKMLTAKHRSSSWWMPTIILVGWVKLMV